MKKILTIVCMVFALCAQAKSVNDITGVYSGSMTISGTAYTSENIYVLPGTETNTVTCVIGDLVQVNVPVADVVISAQPTNKNYDLVNGGFEGSWSNNEPQGWHSFGTATGNFASFVNGNTGQFTQSTDKRPGSTGSYSAHLQSKVVFGAKANGTCTNGQINAGSMTASDASGNFNFSDPSNTGYNTAFVGTPDSLVFWAKYIPADGNVESASNKARAHAVITTAARYQDPETKDYSSVKIADAESNYSATSDKGWQRIAVPFTYYAVSPDQAAYVLMTFTTNATPGGGTSTSSNVDNIYVDDAAFVYNYALKSVTLNGQTVSFTAGQAIVTLPYSEDYEWKVSTNGKGARVFIGYDAQNYKAYIYIAANNYAQGKQYAVYTVQMAAPETPENPQPQQTSYAYKASICPGETYSDELFKNLTKEGIYYDTLPNVKGGDSIIALTLNVLPTYLIDEEIHITVDDDDPVWHGKTISGLVVAENPYIYYDSLKTVAGCDSVYRLSVYVSAFPRTYGAYVAQVCEGDSVEFEKKWYKTAFEGDIVLKQPNHLGGDSIVHLTVEVKPNYVTEEYMSILQGTDRTWEGISLGSLTPGKLTLRVSDFTVDGCDSTRILYLSIISSDIPSGDTDSVTMSDVYGRFDGDLNISGELFSDKSVFILPGTADSTITFVLPDFSFNGGNLGHIVLPNIPMNAFGQLRLLGRTFYLERIAERASITILNGWKEKNVTYFSKVSADKVQIMLYIETTSLPEAIIVRFDGTAVRDKNYALNNGGFEGGWSNNEPAGWHSFGTATGAMSDFVKGNTAQFISSYDVRPGSQGSQSALLSSTFLLSVKANGNCTNGQINAGTSSAADGTKNYNFSDPDNAGYNTAFHGRPDSLVFWAKYLPADRNTANPVNKARMNTVITTNARYQDPENQDYSSVKIAAAECNYSAKADFGWQRVSVPFAYADATKDQQPAYILTTFTTNMEPGGGSSYVNEKKMNVLDSLYLDDVAVVYNKQLGAFSVSEQALPFENHIAHVADTYCDDCEKFVAESEGVTVKNFIGFDPDRKCIHIYVIADDYAQTKAYNIYRVEFSDSQTSDLKPITQLESVQMIKASTMRCTKRLINGQIIIVRDDNSMFDLLGRKIR
jgi:hypothetical protein